MPPAPGKAWTFAVSVEQAADTVILRLSGRFGHRAAPEFEHVARQCLESGAHSVVVDLAGVDYLSSPGLRGVVALATALQARKGQVVVRGARDAVRVTLALADFTKTRQSRRQ
jgi:anti-anti-sigma factor